MNFRNFLQSKIANTSGSSQRVLNDSGSLYGIIENKKGKETRKRKTVCKRKTKEKKRVIFKSTRQVFHRKEGKLA